MQVKGVVEVGGLEPPSHDVVPGLLRAQPPGMSRTWVVRWHRIQVPARLDVPERERAPRSGGACYRRPTRSRRRRAADGHLSNLRQRARSCSWRLFVSRFGAKPRELRLASPESIRHGRTQAPPCVVVSALSSTRRPPGTNHCNEEPPRRAGLSPTLDL